MATTLTCLPNELLDMIVSYLSSPVLPLYRGHTFDLAPLAIVNRRFHALVNPALYKFNKAHDSSSAISYAVVHGRLETLELALAFGLDLGGKWRDETTEYSWRPSTHALHLAARHGHDHVVRWLLDHGMPVDDTVTLPDFEGPVARMHRSPLYEAIMHDAESTAILLLSRGAPPYFLQGFYHNPTRPDVTALHLAAKCGQKLLVEYLVRDRGLQVDFPDACGETSLHRVIRGGLHPGIVRKLIELGADINATTNSGELPISVAICTGQLDVANILLDAGARIELECPRAGVANPIHHCCALNYARLVLRRPQQSQPHDFLRRLIDAGADLEKRYLQGSTPLGEAIRMGTPETIEALLLAGACPDAPAQNGFTPLDLVWRSHENSRIIRDATLLLRFGARMDAKDPASNLNLLERSINLCNYNCCATEPVSRSVPLDAFLSIATRQNVRDGYVDELLEQNFLAREYFASEVLVRHGAVLKESDKKVYAWAMDVIGQDGRPYDLHTFEQVFGFLLDMPISTTNMERLFFQALIRKDTRACQMLIGRGVLAESSNHPHWIHMVVRWGDSAVLKRMLTRGQGVDLNALCERGYTPLATAVAMHGSSASQEHFRAFRLLIEGCANPFTPEPRVQDNAIGDNDDDVLATRQGVSAFEIAMQDHNTDALWHMTYIMPQSFRPSDIYLPMVSATSRGTYEYVEFACSIKQTEPERLLGNPVGPSTEEYKEWEDRYEKMRN